MSMYDDEPERMTHPLLDPKYDYLLFYEVDLPIATSEGDFNFQVRCYRCPASDDPEIEKIRVELTREDHIYYVAICEIDPSNFREKIGNDQLRKSFAEFPELLTSILERTKKQRTIYTVRFDDINRRLEFRQKLQYKSVSILRLSMTILDQEDDYVLDLAQFRYELKAAQYKTLEMELERLMLHLKTHKPNMYSQLQRGQDFNQFKVTK